MVSQMGGPTLVFSGAYVQMGLLLTGEHANYDRKHAIFGRVLPDHEFKLGGGGGALELTFGYSFIDLNDKDIQGGLAQTFTVGLNWYVNNTMRFMANYVDTLDYDEDGSSDDGDEPSAFMLRGQIYW